MKTYFKLLTLLLLTTNMAFSQLKSLGDSINSSKYDFRPMLSEDGRVMFFTRQNETQLKRDSQTVWMSTKLSNGEWRKAWKLPDYINSQKYNSVYWCSPDAREILLRGCYDSTNKGKRGFSVSINRDGRWTYPQEVKINNISNFDRGIFTGATMSTDRKVLIMYFSDETNSDMNDLWLSKYDSLSESYSEPVKLSISEADADEIVPYLATDDKTLFFASDKRGGFGDKDIYVTKRLDTTWENWARPVNIGKPFNSKYFDAYFSISNDGYIGYAATKNKSILGFVGESDIVCDSLPFNLRPEKPIEPIHDTITITILKCDTVWKTIPCDPLDTLNDEQLKAELKRGRILFDYGSSVLRSDDYKTLDIIAKIMLRNPGMKVELGGNSDNKGTTAGNLAQSQERATSAKGYLLSKGIKSNRIETKGYGAKRPLASNETDYGRQLNRRVDIVIISE